MEVVVERAGQQVLAHDLFNNILLVIVFSFVFITLYYLIKE